MKTAKEKNSMNHVTTHWTPNEHYGEREYNDDTQARNKNARQSNAAMCVYCFAFQLCHNFDID